MPHEQFSKKKKKNNNLLWIIFAIILLAGIITGIYFFTKNSSKSPNNPLPGNLQYLPSEAESQSKINQIQQNKGIDQQQATIEFLTSYVPHIKWWEINSLSELDEKINLVNSKTGFPPFSETPEVDKFNQEVEGNMQKKSLMFLASVIPRQADNTPDWKGIKDFQNYMLTVMKPLLEGIKFKPSFATQENYQELARRLKEEISPSLSATCSQFTALNSVNHLNQLTNEYLSKIFQGIIYGEAIHDELGQQLNIANHQKFKLEGTGNHSENEGWNIALNEFAFKHNEPVPPTPNPKPSPDNPTPSPNPIPNPAPSPTPQPSPQPEKWEQEKVLLIANASSEIHTAMTSNAFNVLWSIKKEELQKDWEKELATAKDKAELDQIKQTALKDINELKLASPSERLKLKEHFIFWLSSYEIGLFTWPDGTWNARHMETSLMDDLNQVIKGNKNSTWQRKHMIFTGGFNLNSKDDGEKFDRGIKLDGTEQKWVVIKKDHNQKQYHTERNSFFLRKGEPDYHEFKTRKEAVDFLRQNDSYFKS